MTKAASLVRLAAFLAQQALSGYVREIGRDFFRCTVDLAPSDALYVRRWYGLRAQVNL